ncbi:tyrosine--tRNA ligase [Candidatus Azambacteria bacterium]|nr:tyrosine--tRNA ligase [Candidatus Azambacteria bacterium]
MITDEKKIDELLSRGVEEVIEKEHLKNALLSGKQLRVKFGIDPTAPYVHLGHAVPLRKLKQFQDLGHKVILIIGDFTAKIGDPTGRSEERKPLSDKEIKNNLKNYLKQAGKILDLKKTEVFYNSKWFAKEGMKEIIMLSAAGSIQQVLRRADFKKRLNEGNDITLTEVLYTLFQAYDSVKIKADVEIGGTDQLFNLLMGRRVQRHYGMNEQDILTMHLLEGTDGVKKMSKSVGNYIGLTEKPLEMFEKIMLIPDSLIEKYFLLCTDASQEDIQKISERLKNGENPRDVKLELTERITALYHGDKKAKEARDEFIKIFSKKEKPTEIEEYKLSKIELSLIELLAESGLAKSKSDAKRLVEQGGVSVDDAVHKDIKKILSFKGGEIIKVGKRRFIKVIL